MVKGDIKKAPQKLNDSIISEGAESINQANDTNEDNDDNDEDSSEERDF